MDVVVIRVNGLLYKWFLDTNAVDLHKVVPLDRNVNTTSFPPIAGAYDVPGDRDLLLF
jgi:hypothetical protein